MIHALRNSCDLCKDASILYSSSLASSKFGLREPGDCGGSGGAKASLLPAYLARTPAAYAPGSSHKSIVFENQFWFSIKSVLLFNSAGARVRLPHRLLAHAVGPDHLPGIDSKSLRVL